ncbi:MAG TPA: aspartate aminotransferase family protein [Thermodesulfobacteriota bacterium]
MPENPQPANARDELATHLIPGPMMSRPVIVSGQGAEVTDDEGARYIDLEAGPGVLSVGHCHPKVVEAIRDQAGRLMQGPGRYHSRLTSRLATEITEQTGGQLSRVFFVNSGAEANDGAVKLGLRYATRTGKQGFGIIAMEHGFHGRTALPLSLTGNAGRKKGFGPYSSFPGVVHVQPPYCYRCPLSYKNTSPGSHCGLKCADGVEEALKTRVPGDAAILISESVICVGGVFPPPRDYWPKVAEICAKHGIVLILDEVFSGWGRTGKTFAYQHWDVSPDIVTFAKAIGGGLPLGGFMAKEPISVAFDEGDHFTTFGPNNQVGVAAGLAVLRVMKEENLAEKARVRGEQFMEGLQALARKHRVIGDVRGLGLMIGVELVRSRETREPNPAFTKKIHEELRRRKVLVSTTGVNGSVIRITPPLVITGEQVEASLRAFDEAFSAVSAQ